MIIGNLEARNRLKTYLEQHAAASSGQASFFLLYGPAHIGKSAIALELAQSYLSIYAQSGLLHIKDCSQILGKKHSIKIEENTTTEEYKTLNNDHAYKDIGVREINFRLQQSSFGGYKVLLIENIERMTREATNAFLKACEEPLPGRIILATTSNKSKLLETILSRAIAIPFSPLSQQDMELYMTEKNITIQSPEVKELLIMMAMGKPGTLEQFVQHENREQDIQKLMHLLPSAGKIAEKYKILERCKEQGILEQFLDGRIAYCTHHHSSQVDNRLQVKKLLQQNIKQENLIVYGLLP